MGEITGEEIKIASKTQREVENIPKPLFTGEKKDSVKKLSERLSQIEKNVQEKIQKAEKVLGEISQKDCRWGPLEKKEESRKPQKIDPQKAFSEVEELAQKGNFSPKDYLSRTNKARRILQELNDQLYNERRVLEESYYDGKNAWGIRYQQEYEVALDKINQKLEEIKERKGFKKIFLRKEEERLNKQKIDVENKKRTFEGQIKLKYEQAKEYSEKEKQICEEQEPVWESFQRTLLGEIEQDVSSSVADYEQFYQETIKNENLIREIKENYIQKFISPAVEKLVKEEKLPVRRKEQFYSDLLRADIVGGPEGTVNQRLAQFFESYPEFYNLRHELEPLFEEKEKIILQRSIAKKAANDLKPIAEIGYHGIASPPGAFEFLEAVNPNYPGDNWGARRSDDTFGQKVREAYEGKMKWGYWSEIEFWDALRNSNMAKTFFGEEIKEQDQENYLKALKFSLFNRQGEGNACIRCLRVYPTPEAIRNLVIIAAAKPQEYRTTNANNVLSELSQQSDWPKILDEAEKVYSSLRPLRTVLESWNKIKEPWWTSNQNHPQIKENVGDFALSVYENTHIQSWDGTSLEEALKKLSAEALTNKTLLNVLNQRGAIGKSDAELLKEVTAFLEKPWEKNLDFDCDDVQYEPFNKVLRKRLFSLLEGEEKEKVDIKRLIILSQNILNNQNNKDALSYLTSGPIIDKLPEIEEEKIKLFLEAYQNCPALSHRENLRAIFAKQFIGQETIVFFKKAAEIYKNEERLEAVGELISKSRIDSNRALELPLKAKDFFDLPAFDFGLVYPEFFLDDKGIEFLSKFSKEGFGGFSGDLDIELREKIFSLRGYDKKTLQSKLADLELERIDKLLIANPQLEIDEKNWQGLLTAFIRIQSNIYGNYSPSDTSREIINDLFKQDKAKDFCLEQLQKNWQNYLRSDSREKLPFSLSFLTFFADYHGGIGHLGQLEAMNNFIRNFNEVLDRQTTVTKTQSELFQGLLTMEERMFRERWGDEERVDFYHTSSDILKAAPSLFSSYLRFFNDLNPANLRHFSKEIYPFYRAKLTFMEKKDTSDRRVYEIKDLVKLRHDIDSFSERIKTEENPFETKKTELVDELKEVFKDRFGIIKIPEDFTNEHIRSLTNISMYLANLHNRDEEKTTILGFYLSLMINERWDEFRRGVVIKPEDYLIPDKSRIIHNLLRERESLNPLKPENLGIKEEEMLPFLKLLQQETQNVVIGDVETIDVKLNNVILNLEGLEDLDLYPELLDKQRMNLLINFGNKALGAATARMYQNLSGRTAVFSDDEKEIQGQIKQVFETNKLELTPGNLKRYFQDDTKPLATVVNLLQFIRETKAREEIKKIRSLLEPSLEVINVFNKLGENFKQTSGALAVSQDLNYLDNLIVKREDEITSEEKIILTDYTGKIREQIINLQGIYDQIKNKFIGMKQGNINTNNQLLKDKLNQIDKIINNQSMQQPILSTVTGNLNTIIENIRECLSCTHNRCNNDTNLTFGDMNRFYLYSQSESQPRGSISDELLFLEPIIHQDESQEMAFVFDKLYETNTPPILTNQIETVMKKYKEIKKNFPDIKLSLFITDTAISSGGMSEENLLTRLKEISRESKTFITKEDLGINIVESAMGDHYIEFAGDARTPGIKRAKGIYFKFL